MKKKSLRSSRRVQHQLIQPPRHVFPQLLRLNQLLFDGLALSQKTRNTLTDQLTARRAVQETPNIFLTVFTCCVRAAQAWTDLSTCWMKSPPPTSPPSPPSPRLSLSS